MDFLFDIFKALFGTPTYQYRVYFADKKGSLDIDAEDFIDAQLRAKTIQNIKLAYIVPLEDVSYTDGEKGSNSYLFETKIQTNVFGENEAQAKQNAKLHITEDSVEIVKVKMPIWVNKKHYKGE